MLELLFMAFISLLAALHDGFYHFAVTFLLMAIAYNTAKTSRAAKEKIEENGKDG